MVKYYSIQSSHRHNYYELLDIISKLNTQIHYPGG